MPVGHGIFNNTLNIFEYRGMMLISDINQNENALPSETRDVLYVCISKKAYKVRAVDTSFVKY